MRKNFSRLLFCTILLSVITHAVGDSSVTPTLVFRSQSRDKVRQMVGVTTGSERTNQTHRYNMETWYGMGSIMVEYTQSFHNNRIARCLFGDDLFTGTGVTTACQPCDSSSNDCGKTILIQGSKVANRNTSAWLADYFYLPSDFKGAITFNPRVRNVIVDLDFYLGLDECASGMYFRIYGPIVNTRWDLNFRECIDNAGTNSHPEGYFAPSCISNAVLLKSFADYANGKTITSCNGITFQPLKFAKITPCERTKTGFADLRAEFGWNFCQGERYHVGANVQFAAPTGNRRCAEFAFDPVVGNGHHWEAGGGITGHYTFCRSEDEETTFSLHLDANLTTIFKAKEQRTFDLRGKPNSRYMLASKFTSSIVNSLSGFTTAVSNVGAGTAPVKQFALEYAPVANLTTLNINTSAGVQADIVAMFNLSAGGFSWDLGYNFWARSCEKIHCPTSCPPCDGSLCDPTQADTWALKGDARMFGFTVVPSGNNPINTPIPLSATQSLATIHKGTNQDAVDGIGQDFYKRNFGVDNSLFAVGGNVSFFRLVYAPFLPAPDAASNQIKTSVQPIFINCDDIDFCERSRGISHKIFTHFGYAWVTEHFRPFVGIGAFGEFGKHHKGPEFSSPSSDCCNLPCPTPCPTNKNKCLDCALSQWGVWIKGGLAFD